MVPTNLFEHTARCKHTLYFVTAVGVALFSPLLAQTKKTASAPIPAGDWPTYTRDLAGTRYSPLTQISTGNVANLTQAWSVCLAPAAGGRGGVGFGVLLRLPTVLPRLETPKPLPLW